MKHLSSLPFLLLSFRLYTSAIPVDSGIRDGDMQLAKKYLNDFYSPDSAAIKRHKTNVSDAMTEQLKEMQRFFRLRVTGKMDAETLDVMKKPRCGVPDTGKFERTTGNPKWPNNHITYRIEKYTRHLPQLHVDKAIEKAFEVWSKVTPLTFERRTTGFADIMISFVEGDHNDNSPFDGPNGILAHAFQPGNGIGGDTHFDDAESWTVQGRRGFNLFLVAAHEFGHALGLAHSNDPGALMYPTYSFTEPSTFKLHQDDINGIQDIYGKTNNRVQPTGPTTPTACDPRTSFDAVANLRGEMVFFKGRHFWRKHPQLTNVEQYFISLFWPELPSEIDAAYESYEQDHVLLFKGDKYWVLNGYQIVSGSPKSIYQLGFPATVKKIDAAFSDPESGKTYFFVGNQYWRYDEFSQRMERGYPKRIARDFKGVGPQIDAALQHDGYVYFFQGPRLIQFDLNSKRVVANNQRSNSFLNC
ncbi:hypothetical protein lerEdw1_005906 [Lerista edwardsae]|nr:hypothetical protein lerEdw1_005906 [Lerista edwardsae]